MARLRATPPTAPATTADHGAAHGRTGRPTAPLPGRLATPAGRDEIGRSAAGRIWRHAAAAAAAASPKLARRPHAGAGPVPRSSVQGQAALAAALEASALTCANGPAARRAVVPPPGPNASTARHHLGGHSSTNTCRTGPALGAAPVLASEARATAGSRSPKGPALRTAASTATARPRRPWPLRRTRAARQSRKCTRCPSRSHERHQSLERRRTRGRAHRRSRRHGGRPSCSR